jgi:hypothetical protein
MLLPRPDCPVARSLGLSVVLAPAPAPAIMAVRMACGWVMLDWGGWCIRTQSSLFVRARESEVPFFAEIKSCLFGFPQVCKVGIITHTSLSVSTPTQSNEHGLRTLRSAMDA